MGQDPQDIRAQLSADRQRIGDDVDAIAYKADVPSRARDAVNDATQNVKDAVGDATENVKGAAQRGVRVARENPLGLMLATAGIGFILGSLLPRTDFEDEKLGQVADGIKQKAQDMGTQAVQKGQTVIRDTIDAAQKSTQEQFST